MDALKARYAWFSGQDYASTRVGDYVLTNNVWGAGGVTDREEYVFTDDREGITVAGWTWRWPYKPAGTVEPSYAGAVNVGAFVQYLLDHRYVDASWYLSCLQFGNEVYHGTGKTIVNAFRIELA